MSQLLGQSLFSKIDESLERTIALVRLANPVPLDWKPAIDGAGTAGWLFKHLVGAALGFCAVFAAAWPERFAHLSQYRVWDEDRSIDCPSAENRLTTLRIEIRSGADTIEDRDLARVIPTVFVPEGEPVMTLFLDNLEHLINHKHQLFLYLRLRGISVTTADLYRF